MKRIAIVGPKSLVARELADQLAERPDVASDIRLLSCEDDDVGQLSSTGGGAAIIQRLDEDGLAGVDAIVVCTSWAETEPLLGSAPDARVVLVAPESATPDGTALVPSGGAEARPDGLLVSPQPATVALTRVTRPLHGLGLTDLTATVALPVSALGSTALDDLFAQTRDLLSFQPVKAGGALEVQHAFNLMASDLGGLVENELGRTLESPPRLAVQLLRAGVFHGLAISIAARFDPAVDVEAVRDALASAPGVELVEPTDRIGPIDAASRSGLLVGPVERADGGWIRLWAVMDDLRDGSAANTLAILATI